jgi:SAM-dependent methyltransferase
MTSVIAPQPNPLFRLIQLASGLWVSRALWAAAQLRLADAVGDAATPLSEIARSAGAHEAHLRRLMNALVSIGLFRAAGEDRYAHSELSQLLKSDHPLSQRTFIATIFGGEHYAAWGAIDRSLSDGTTAFDSVYGMPVFDWYSRNPEAAQDFSHAMASSTMLLEAALLGAWDPPPFELAVDVGGSRGTLLAALLQRRPEARGILFDLPDIADAVLAAGAQERMEVVGGDFFAAVPEGDLYLLKLILHDWDDERSAAILRNIRAAIRPGGRVVIIDALLPDKPGDHAGFLMDLNMMVMTGGRERSAADFGALLKGVGFRLEKVMPTPTPIGLVQAVAD